MLVCAFFVHIAHETAGAARIRHSLLPHSRDNEMQASGKSCRENADVYLLLEIEIEKMNLVVPDKRA